MKNKLDIVANHYSETPDIVRRFLDSIEMQDGIDFSDICVWILSDGIDKKMPLDVMKGYSFPIRYFAVEHRGKCSLRNLLMDSTEAPYIMFCDIDDCFVDKNGLKRIFDAMALREPNVIASDYYGESMRDGKLKKVLYKNDIIRVHGKAYRRKYLTSQNIRYCDKVQVNADQYFMWQAFALTDNIAWIHEPFYCWKYNDKSTTREQSGFNVRTYDSMMTAYSLLAQNLIGRMRIDLYIILLCNTISMMYLQSTLHPDFKKDSDETAKAHKVMCAYLKRYLPHYKKIPTEIRKRYYLSEAGSLGIKDAEKYFDGIMPWIDHIITHYD